MRPDYVVDPKQKRAKYTIDPSETWYRMWHIIIILNSLYSSIVYPHYTMNGFPLYHQYDFALLGISEGFFIIDIIFNFIKQGIDEEGNTKQEPIK